MPYANNYIPIPDQKAAEHELYGPKPYDINFALPLPEETLDTPSLKLVPFIPSDHAQIYWDKVKDHRSALYRYYSRYLPSLPDFLTWLLPPQPLPNLPGHHRQDVSLQNLQMEPGYILVLPEFQPPDSIASRP
ncbi:hypothetical protein BN946_scf184845.g42 [Trametes cinnabarina]|uniref:Uncharacterized protein n=1 Tax=Pycnoporus cinnabarinus TaxID=5643 RepID=A0A060S9J5_PYCCI|nr:hypothetical protein BN946_scf184845.g42 [Trametes cinnabarina]